VYSGELIFGKTFSDVPEGKPVTYLNSLLNFSLGVNMGSFADLFHVGSGSGWIIEVSKSR
jgi:S-adenosylmethionine hydrolase